MNEGITERAIKTYKELGAKYLGNLSEGTPVEIYDFMDLLPKGGKVLDVGCAGGRDSKLFVERGFEVVGIDMVEEFLSEARRLVPGATFMKSDARDLLFENESFDAIYANAVLLHFTKNDVGKALTEFYRVLNRGGFVHVRVKEGEETKAVIDALSEGKKREFTFFNQEEIRELFEEAGFEVKNLRTYPDESGRKEVIWVSCWGFKK